MGVVAVFGPFVEGFGGDAEMGRDGALSTGDSGVDGGVEQSRATVAVTGGERDRAAFLFPCLLAARRIFRERCHVTLLRLRTTGSEIIRAPANREQGNDLLKVFDLIKVCQNSEDRQYTNDSNAKFKRQHPFFEAFDIDGPLSLLVLILKSFHIVFVFALRFGILKFEGLADVLSRHGRQFLLSAELREPSEHEVSSVFDLLSAEACEFARRGFVGVCVDF